MAYSKESARQNKVLAGRKTEDRIFVGYEGKKKEKGNIESELTEVMQEARMPWFCPNCDKVMGKKLDDKMWRLFGHCFDCQIKIEHKHRLEGTYEEWAKEKVRQNKISFVKDSIEKIKEWRDMKAPEWYNNVGVDTPEVERETWNVDMDKVRKTADEALEEYTKVLNELENAE